MHVGLMVSISNTPFSKFESVVPAIPDMNFGKCGAAGKFMPVKRL
jgi:hypothetical protein